MVIALIFITLLYCSKTFHGYPLPWNKLHMHGLYILSTAKLLELYPVNAIYKAPCNLTSFPITPKLFTCFLLYAYYNLQDFFQVIHMSFHLSQFFSKKQYWHLGQNNFSFWRIFLHLNKMLKIPGPCSLSASRTLIL